jgi:hypothetical protein
LFIAAAHLAISGLAAPEAEVEGLEEDEDDMTVWAINWLGETDVPTVEASLVGGVVGLLSGGVTTVAVGLTGTPNNDSRLLTAALMDDC